MANALTNAAGGASNLPQGWDATLTLAAREEWDEWLDGRAQLKYDVLLARFRRLFEKKLIGTTPPSAAVLQTCFGLTPATARRLRRELLASPAIRFAQLKAALGTPSLSQPKFENRKVFAYSIPDYLAQDLFERCEKAAVALSSKNPPAKYRAPQRVTKGDETPGSIGYAIDDELRKELLKLL